MRVRTQFTRVLTLLRSSTVQQAGWLLLARGFQIGANLVAMLVVARALGPQQLGELTLAITLATFAASIGLLGLEQIATREFSLPGAATSNSVSLSALVSLRFVGAAFSTLLVLALMYVPLPEHERLAPLLAILICLPLAHAGDIAEWSLVATQRSRAVAWITLGSSCTFAALRIFFALIDADLTWFALAFVLEALMRSLYFYRNALAAGLLRITASPLVLDAAKTYLREGLPLLASGIAVYAYMRLDQLMIGTMLGTEQVGLFAAATTLSEAQLILSMAVARSAMPGFVRAYARSPEEFERELGRAISGTFFLILGSAIVIALGAGWLLKVLYGSQFVPAAATLAIHAFTAPFATIGVLSSSWFVIKGNTGHALKRTLVGALVNIALNLILIPQMGIAGAACATLAAQIFAAVLYDAGPVETRHLFLLKAQAVLMPFRRSRTD